MATTSLPGFGEALRRYRLAAGLTQEALAECAGLSRRGISDLERGVNQTPRRETVALLAQALMLSPRERATLEAAARRVAAVPPADSTRPHPDGSRVPFVGRVPELAALERHLTGEGPPLLLLAGEPGIGKTRLLRETAGRARDGGWRVLEGGCQRRGGQEPYAPVLDALKAFIQRQPPVHLRAELAGCAWLARLLPELAEGPIEPLPSWALPPEQERRLAHDAVARFLCNVAGPAGTLLVLDDMQWAGSDALDLLAALARTAQERRLLMVGAYRDTDVQPHDSLAMLLADLAHAGLAARLALGPLAPDEAAALLDGFMVNRSDDGPELRERLLRRAGGVPFFLVSCAQAIGGDDREGVTPDALPWTVAQSVRQRIAALAESAREVLGTAAVIGRVAPYALLRAAAALEEREALAALEAACRARLLAEADAGTYQFAHDVIREVVEADLGAARRAMLHRRVAEALEQGPGALPVELLAYHYGRSEEKDRAAPYLEQAGDRARARYANVAAAGYYQELVERLDGLGRGREATAVREKLGAVLDTAARYDAALAVFEQAASEYQVAGDQEGVWRVLAALGHVHVHRGTPNEGVQRLQPVLAALADADASPDLAALYEALATLCSVSGRYAEGLAAAERALTFARAMGEERIVVAALHQRGAALVDLGRRAEALPALEEAGRLAEALGDLYTCCWALVLAGCVHEDLGAFATAQRFTERALAIAEQRGDPASIAYLTVRRGTGAFFSGDWAAARRDFERALALCRQLGSSMASPYPLLDLGRLCLAEGAWAEAVAYLEESCAISVRGGDLVPLRWAQVELAEHDLLMGRPEAARARLEPLLDRPGLEEGQVVFLLPPLAQAHLELGAVEQAAALVAQGVRRARAQPNQRALVGAQRVQGLVQTRQGGWAEAERAVEEGLALARGMPYPYAEARLLHVAGLLHIQKGEPEQAWERLTAALALFQRLGARKDRERTEQVLAQLGPPSAVVP